MDLNLVELWGRMGMPVKGVVIVLTLQAMACLTVVIDRVVMSLRSKAATASFVRDAEAFVKRGDFAGLRDLAARVVHSPFASLSYAALRAFVDAREHGATREAATELARRAVDRRQEALSAELQRGMNVLASTGSTAPFVGLLGTVLGIIHAFHLIGQNNSGGLGTIGSAIGEALVVTGYGLVVAIPTVLVFNWLSGRLSSLELSTQTAGGELLDVLESGHIPSASSDAATPTREIAAAPAQAN